MDVDLLVQPGKGPHWSCQDCERAAYGGRDSLEGIQGAGVRSPVCVSGLLQRGDRGRWCKLGVGGKI
jgi:hypothetical protein